MSAIYVSHFTPKSVTIPAPVVPLSPGTPGLGASHYGTPAEARTAAYRYALVDVNGQLSPWSDAITIKHPAGGGVAVRPCDFVPDHPEAVYILWSIDDRIGISCEGGDGPDRFGLPPFCPISPNLLTDLRKTGEALPPAGTSTILVDKPPAPQFIPFTVPNADLEWMYVFVTETGETEASPSVVSSGDARLNKAGVGFRRFNLPGMVIPPGVVSYRIYGRTLGGTWRRVGEYPIDCMQPVVYQWPARAGQPAPVASPSSMLSSLQQALSARRTGDVVVVDVPEIVTGVPIVDEWGPHRSKVTGLHGMSWLLDYTGGGEVGYLQQSSYTTLEGMALRGGVKATSNYSGGQAFGCNFRDCDFGIRTLDNSSKYQNDHTESESLYDNCILRGVRLEGIQTASVRFRHCHVYGDWYRRRGKAALWIDTPCLVVFEGGCFADFGWTFAYLGFRANVRVDDVFCDQGEQTIAESFSYYPSKLVFRGGQWNAPDLPNGRAPFLSKGQAQVEFSKDVMIRHGRVVPWREVAVQPQVPLDANSPK